MIYKCKICSSQFVFNSKSASNKENTCSYPCLRKTGILRKKYLITFLKNRNCYFDENDMKEMEDLFSKIQSKNTKLSVEKKHNTMKERYGDLNKFFKKSGKNSRVTLAKKTLLNNNVLTQDQIENISEADLLDKYNDFYYKTHNHGQKIKDGRLKKHGTKEQVRLSYKNASMKAICARLKLDYEKTMLLPDIEIKSIVKLYKNEIKFFNNNSIKWKKTHLINAKIINKKDDIKDEDVVRYYSEYLSERVKSNILHYIGSGYKKSKKGWYLFENKDGKFFYRSSWELLVLEKLDKLLLEGSVVDIQEPDRIKYFYDGRFRYYYPDISYTTKSGANIILEIKPQKFLEDEMNKAKFEAASKVYKNYLILCQDKIFSEDLENILIESMEKNV